MKKLFFLFLLPVLLLSVMAVSAGDLDDVNRSGELRFGVPAEYIPFVFDDEDGNPTGIDVALMEEIGRRMGVRVHVISLAFDGMIDALNLGQVDVIGGAFAVTDERAGQIDFTASYYNSDAKFVGLAGVSAPEQVSPETFRYLKIGVQKGTSFDQWVKSNLVSAGFVSPVNVFTFSTAADAMNALDRGDVDLVLLDEDVYEKSYAGSGSYDIFYDGFATENYAFGLRRDSDLTEVINGHLMDMLHDGTAQSIADRFFRMDFTDASVTRDRSAQYFLPAAGSAAQSCVNGMVFVSDVTIKDGQTLYADESFTKVWRVKNTGSCTWTPDYSFVFTSGSRMSGRDIRISKTVAPGQTVDLSVDMIAPGGNGTYKGYWQMRSPQGIGFGQTVWVKIRVNGSAAAPAQKPRDDGQVYQPVSILAFYPDFYVGEADECVTAFWSADGADRLVLSVDGTPVFEDDYDEGSYNICGPVMSTGNHLVELHVFNVTASDFSSFIYTAIGNDDWDRWLENNNWEDGRNWNDEYPEPDNVIDYPEGIDDPEWNPEFPEEPEDPELNPEFPEEPEDPELNPEFPEEPEDPELNPEFPEEPEDPELNPEFPEEPEYPDEPEYPEEPDYPDGSDELPEPDYDELCDPDAPDYWECRAKYYND